MRYPKLPWSLPMLVAAVGLGAPAAAQQAQTNSSSDIVLAQAEYRAPQRQARISPTQVRQILHRAGYRRVSRIRYFRVVRGTDYYLANAWSGGRQYQLQVSDQTGRITNRSIVGANYVRPDDRALVRGVDRIEVRQMLLRQGYTGISDIEFIGEVHDDHFVATAWKNGRQYRLIIDDDHGRILRRTLIR